MRSRYYNAHDEGRVYDHVYLYGHVASPKSAVMKRAEILAVSDSPQSDFD